MTWKRFGSASVSTWTRYRCRNRWVYYWTDLARALAAGGQDRQAMHALARAERSAPQHFRFNPVVRDLVATLIQRARRRAVGEEMLSLAHKLGLDAV
jgi:hypothetical protein